MAAGPGDSELRQVIEQLCALAFDVAVVGGRSVEDVDGRLQARPRGPGRLHLLPGGSDVFAVGAEGPVATGRLAEGSGAVDWILDELWRSGTAPELVLVAGEELGPETIVAYLGDQLDRRRRRAVPRVAALEGWHVAVSGMDPELERVNEALLTLGDGRIGTSGAPIARAGPATPGVFAAGAWAGEGAETELLEAPAWNLLSWELQAGARLERVLDLRTGLMRQELETAEGRMEAALFSSLARPGTAALRVEGPASRLRVGDPFIADAEPESPEGGRVGEPVFARATSDEEAISAVAVEQVEELPGGRRRLERVALYEAHPAAAPVAESLMERLQRVEAAGYERLLAEQRRTWSGRWEDADVIVEGDPELQLGIRLGLYHLMASVADEGEAVVGARGLSGPAYRGHVFWDADVHVLPFLAATHPTAARAMLEYRIRRLDAARRAAQAGGYRGARFPWESARSGADVTPRTGRDPTGESVEIKTGLEEEHITADVAWAACCYADWTGDRTFIAGPGRDLLVETARYWASRARVDADGRAHIDKVIGPDEYHVDVDDNAFTNVMARWNLRRGAEAARAHGGAGDEEVAEWLRVADALVDGYDPETGLYEQFAGFFALEPLVAADWLRRPVAAHLLLGSRRVESSQVLKQADVLMLHQLLPDEVVPGSLEPNLGFYEPRTAHASSLSPGMHASLLARAERLAEAVDWLRLAARIDLEDITQTTAGGVHLATMGSVWQALVWGFAGARPAAGRLAVDPRLPDSWSALEVRVRYRGTRVRVRSERDSLALWAERDSELLVGPERTPVAVGPAGVTLPRR